MGGSADHLWPTADCQAKVGLTGVTLPHLEQANGQIGTRHCIFRSQRKRASIGVRGRGILTVHQKGARERCQNIRTVPRELLCLQQDCARLAALIALQMEASQIQFQIDTLRRERQGAFDDVDCFAKMSIAGELSGQLLKGRKKWWPPRGGAAQEFDSLGATSGGAQCRTEKGFDGRIIVAARRLLQRRDRLLFAFLRQQRPGQDRHRSNIGPARFQHFGGKLLGLAELSHPQRKGGALEQLRVRVKGSPRYVWHWYNLKEIDRLTAISMASGTKKHLSDRQETAGGSSCGDV